MVQRKGRGSVCGCARGKTSGNGMTISALVHSRHPSSTDSENDFENIGVALGDSVTEFRVERVSEERRWNYESIDKRVILKEPGFSKDAVIKRSYSSMVQLEICPVTEKIFEGRFEVILVLVSVETVFRI